MFSEPGICQICTSYGFSTPARRWGECFRGSCRSVDKAFGARVVITMEDGSVIKDEMAIATRIHWAQNLLAVLNNRRDLYDLLRYEDYNRFDQDLFNFEVNDTPVA